MAKHSTKTKFRYAKVKQGLRFYLKHEETKALYDLLHAYITCNDSSQLVIQKLLQCILTRLFLRVQVAANGLIVPITTITMSKEEALAFYNQVNVKWIVPANLYEGMVMQNIFSAIDKEVL